MKNSSDTTGNRTRDLPGCRALPQPTTPPRDIFPQSTRYPCHIKMKLEFTRQIFGTSSNTKFHENPSSGSRVAPFGRTDRQTDITKLKVAFRNFAHAPKICIKIYNGIIWLSVGFAGSLFEPEGKRPLGRPRRRWEDIIKMDLQEVGCGSMDWIQLAQYRDR